MSVGDAGERIPALGGWIDSRSQFPSNSQTKHDLEGQ